MLLYQPSARQIKSLALSCISVWPSAEDAIWKAAALVGTEAIRLHESPTGSLFLHCRSSSSDKEYSVVMQWVPSDAILSKHSRVDVFCSCPAWNHNPSATFLDHNGSLQRCCKHTIALLMYRRLIEDQAALLDHPTPEGVTWHPVPNLDRLVLDEFSLIRMSIYLAGHYVDLVPSTNLVSIPI